ncbi:two component histidine kinase 1 [Lepidopterella palustris CBS 459.81]|uniref:histidine kinase n=1 Tax=Lepidopterella palustris CBS 459.81 TaxID=1314670 RepID=A0A8E2EKB6_9PEZI|nr:two component histidine kinase 1 [Lepidopterella palustris CBS 459.81]
MENIDRLAAAGYSIFDLNAEYLKRTDWSRSHLGAQEKWPESLNCFVNLIATFPHPSCIFWGKDLAVVHNLAWGTATRYHDGQGGRANDCFSGEALSSIQTSIRGRTVKVACRLFLPNDTEYGPDDEILLSTLLDNSGSRQGVFAQFMHTPSVARSMYLPGLQYSSNEKSDARAKPWASQQTGGKRQNQVDAKQTQLFQRFAELVPNGLAILDSDAEAVFVNDGFFKLTTNKTSKEFRAWPESIDSRDYEKVMAAYREAFSNREELRVEFRCAASKEEEWRLFLLRPLSDEPEAGFICAVVDITEIKHAELAQEKAANEAQERKEQQERFIDMVSHEIRNPLSAVLHLAEEIKDVAHEVEDRCKTHIHDQVADITDAAETILLCVSHQSILVDDILSFSKLDSMMLSLVPRVIQPKWNFAKALKVFSSELKAKSIKFEYAIDVSYETENVDFVVADLNRMTQVLVNLVTNAIKFTARKDGERHISVAMGASTERPTSYPPNVVFFETREDAFHVDSTMTAEWGQGPTMYLMIAIKDTGIGISAENQAKLFERFRQATPKTQEKYGGSGLGLFISRKLCQLHGGDIGVSSKDGEGSTFGFFFKVRRSEGPTLDGRPHIGRASSQRTSETPAIPGPGPGRMLSRPSYSRQNSTFNATPERPKIYSHTSQPGADNSDVPSSLKDPPVEYRGEAHPEASPDDRYRETERVAENIKMKKSPVAETIDSQLPDSLDQKSSETLRQMSATDATELRQSMESAETRPTILLVEDNLINQKVLRRQLQSRGFQVYIANNGQEAIDAVKAMGESKELEQNYFDCILMDQEMPIKDGNTATMEIRDLQEGGEVGWGPILGISANVREEQRNSMLEAGMDEVISKPFKVDELVRRIKGLLQKR